MHFDGWDDAYHCLDEPYGLARWRSALFVAYPAEHLRLRVVGVDGRIGPDIDEALDELVELGWIGSELRESIPLIDEEEDMGYGFFRFHHHHMHSSINTLYDVIAAAEVKPDMLNRSSQGRFITACIEPIPGIPADVVDVENTALVLDGRYLVFA